MKKRKISSYDQLMRLLQNEEQKALLIQTIEPLKPKYVDDFCLACIAYIKFGVRRPFSNMLMWVIFESYLTYLDN